MAIQIDQGNNFEPSDLSSGGSQVPGSALNRYILNGSAVFALPNNAIIRNSVLTGAALQLPPLIRRQILL